MKCQSKHDRYWGETIIIIKGRIYECELTPTITDPITLNPAKPSYIVTCEDGYLRKFDADNFITLEELRELKLKELGI